MTDDALLHHALVTAEGAPPPARWLVVLHGILGSGANWRSFARRVVAARPAWGVVLCDLRAHGLSQGARPPHTLVAAAGDLVRLEAALAAEGRRVAGVMGHSFGGKVALAYAAARAAAGAPPLDALLVLDSSPGIRGAEPTEADPEAPTHVLDFLEALPDPLPSRERFFELAAAAGLGRGVAEWLAMNVRREGDVLRLRLDLAAIRALVADYFAEDIFPVLASTSAARRVDVVLGGRSKTVSRADRARLDALAGGARHLEVHELPHAGHWVHVDDPDGLFAVVKHALAER
jgi:pimeloyl-ACP methyl ester carboxylesterase